LKHIAPTLGIKADVHGVDWARVIKWSRDVSTKNSSGVEFIVKKLGINRSNGRFRVVGEREVEVLDVSSGAVIDRVKGKHVIIATGSENRSIPGVAVDRERVITYKEAMLLPEQPQELVVIGAGAIGIEFAYFYAALGTKVTVIEMLPRILPTKMRNRINLAFLRNL
jgi:dihydrolipoamide dehydrogenase